MVGRVFGVVHLDGCPVSETSVERMSRAVAAHATGPRATAVHVGGCAGLGFAQIGGRGARPAFPYVHAPSGVVVTSDIRLSDRRDLMRSLGLTPDADLSEGRLVAEAYIRWGEDFPMHIRGEFAVAVWDPTARSILLARDHLGCGPVFFMRNGSMLAFASDLNGVLASIDSVPDLDEEWIADLLTGNTSDPERTAYPGVRRVVARHLVVASEKGTRTRAYWDLDRSPDPAYARTEQYEDELRERLAGSVRASMPHDGLLVGCELSGGLDSSVVTALVASEARARGAGMIALTHVLADDLLGVVWPFEDERALAAALRRHAGIDRHIHVTADGYDIVESLRTSIVAQGAPSNGTYDLFSDALRDEAGSRTVTSLYSGFGGDEMISGTASLVPESWIRRGELRRLLSRLPGASGPRAKGWRRRLLRSSARYWLRATGGGSRAHEALAQGRAFAHSLVERLPVSSAWAERWELHARAMAQWQALAEAAAGSDNESYERYQMLRPSTAMRLEACNVAAAGRGVAYRYPLLDVSLLEWFHSVPAEQKWGAGWGRYLVRRSFTGVVPDELLWRNVAAQTNTIPNLVGRYKASEASIRALISRARSRHGSGFLDFGKLDRWADSFFAFASAPRGSAVPETLAPGRFARVLALLLYYEMREGRWRPGPPVAPTDTAGSLGRVVRGAEEQS